MGKIIVSHNVTLDGVGQDPTGEEGIGGWANRLSDDDRAAWAKVEQEEAIASTAMLLGRRSYDWFASRWVTRTGEWADRLRDLPKYVVSTTLTELPWPNTTVIALAQVEQLKSRIDGDIVVYGSQQLAHALFDRGLVDEVRLMVYPSVAGAGDRLFASATALRLVDSRRIGDNLAFLTYRTD
ncbi:dihydrofolate reductase family protein [Asanoa iriomotensis]|uniref:Pyrimidine reductase n=1 Tax=Asanoa iriomotensis TaxID=234613 RepID=A0ABQ4BXE6_9ACTN|nr:dihydrofolate reductase family protein [Asanoa iriomotensis]GIF55202.1 pyrimidine reductase [Asanoa iriomotensis]